MPYQAEQELIHTYTSNLEINGAVHAIKYVPLIVCTINRIFTRKNDTWNVM